MAEWTQELETFAGASVSSGERRERQLSPNSAGLERSEECAMEALELEDRGLWEPLGPDALTGGFFSTEPPGKP